MSSRDGPRAAGTDGSDFSHRERVASHYRESVRQKAKLKFCLSFHLFLGACVVCWIVLTFLGIVKLALDPWMFAWLLSTIPAIVGHVSIPKNRVKLMYVFAVGNIFIGIGPLMYGATLIVTEVMDSLTKGFAPGTQDWRVLPMKMAFIAFVIQVHAISIYYATKLISSWTTKGEKKS